MSSAPGLATLGLGALVLYEMSRQQRGSDLVKRGIHPNSSLTTGQHNASDWNHPASHQIWVDTPVNTVLESWPGGRSLEQVYRQQKAQYVKEASESPGVNLVAHTVA